MKDSEGLRSLMMKAALLLLLMLSALSVAHAQLQAAYKNPVIAGDYPDPSVIRVGKDYYATATSGEWAPEFPILHSRDLLNWEIVGAVFRRRPDWAQGNFWAPEISYDKGRYFVYYTARKKGGPLCVAVASSNNAAGPYTDHGPLVCQEIGSIDAMAVTDEKGERYLIWKEDGNSREKPTPLWAQKLSADGTKLAGEKKELFRNDPKSWEGGVVEGAFVLKRGEWFYLFYSGNACCGRRCNYALGVARSRKLLGPWEKNPANPILAENQLWQCPGHGSIVTDEEGRDLLLYHAYRHGEEAFYIGREALLDEIKWDGPNGWPTINAGKGPGASPPIIKRVIPPALQPTFFFDDFTGTELKPGWQWPQSNEPLIRVEGGQLTLAPTGIAALDPIGAVISQPTTSADYVATALVNLSTRPSAFAGLSAYNGRSDALGVVAGNGKIQIYKREARRHQIVTEVNVPGAFTLHLRMSVKDGYEYRFAYSTDGREWKEIGGPVSGGYLEGVRVALTVGGSDEASAKFDWLRITPNP
ncbi:MAG TPA: family 43 glycosylhydrolase [Pyrinomonadaceae bacterium]|nr:family 43 glycosylhydrolase [Pyrinomonadaceae bacterium]